MKKTIFIFVLLMTVLTVTAQTKIVYTYDANGNRISRRFQGYSSAAQNSKNSETRVTDNKLTINIPLNARLEDCFVMIYDLYGRALDMRTVTSYEESIDISHLSAGIYILCIIVGDEIENKKFIKQ